MLQFHKIPLTTVVLDLSTLGNIKSQMYPLPSRARKKKSISVSYRLSKPQCYQCCKTRLMIFCSCLSLFCHWRLLINV